MTNLEKVLNEMKQEACKIPGKIGFYFELLGEERSSFSFHPDLEVVAASVIKLPVMAEFYAQVQEGTVDPGQLIRIRKDQHLPSCGVLSYLHEGVEMTLEDICTLMIIVSDNTASNILIDLLGMEQINAKMQSLGLQHLRVNRRLFDAQASARGIQNRICAEEIGILLRKIFDHALPFSEKMLEILSNQQLNGKIPFYLNAENIRIDHKTGEDDGITHDAAIVYASVPFILVFVSEDTDTALYERWMQEKTKAVFEAVNE